MEQGSTVRLFFNPLNRFERHRDLCMIHADKRIDECSLTKITYSCKNDGSLSFSFISRIKIKLRPIHQEPGFIYDLYTFLFMYFFIRQADYVPKVTEIQKKKPRSSSDLMGSQLFIVSFLHSFVCSFIHAKLPIILGESTLLSLFVLPYIFSTWLDLIHSDFGRWIKASEAVLAGRGCSRGAAGWPHLLANVWIHRSSIFISYFCSVDFEIRVYLQNSIFISTQPENSSLLPKMAFLWTSWMFA